VTQPLVSGQATKRHQGCRSSARRARPPPTTDGTKPNRLQGGTGTHRHNTLLCHRNNTRHTRVPRKLAPT